MFPFGTRARHMSRRLSALVNHEEEDGDDDDGGGSGDEEDERRRRRCIHPPARFH